MQGILNFLDDLLQRAAAYNPDLQDFARTRRFEDAPLYFQVGVWVLCLAPLLPLLQAYLGNPQRSWSNKTFLNPESWQELPLSSVKEVSHDTRRLRFALPHATPILGLPTGQHITLQLRNDEGALVLRPYTPVTDDFHRGYVEFVIKLYPEGRMSRALAKLRRGDLVGFKGPKGRFVYKPGAYKAIGMVAGGSGITPMFQILQAILRDKNDPTPLSLVFCNRTEGDILLRRELEALQAKHPEQLKVHFVLDTAPEGWTGSTGYCTAPLLQEHLPPPGPEVLVLYCGPPPMVKALDGLLETLQYTDFMTFRF